MVRVIFDKYILFVSILMLAQGLLFVISLFVDLNTVVLNNLANYLFGYLFFFSLVNVILIGISGIVFLTERKTLKLGIFALLATGLFLWSAIQVGRDL